MITTILQKRLWKSPFFWLTALFLLTAKGHIEIIDTDYSIRTAKAIIEEGTMLIEPVDTNNRMPVIAGNDKIYSQYGIAILAIFVPIVAVAKLLSIASGLNESIVTHFLLSFYNIPFALLGLWHFREILKKIGHHHNSANFLMICLATGTIFWKYVVTDFSEVTQIFLLLGAIHSYMNRENSKRWFFVSCYLSLLILLKLAYIIVLPPFVVLALIEGSKEKKLFNYLAQGASFLTLAGLFLIILNWHRYDNPFESGYGTAQSAFSLDYLKRDFLDYLISFDRGLFTYSPLLSVALVGLRKFFKKEKKLIFLILTVSVALLLLNASWIGWKGGYCWGNRNTVTIVPLLALGWGFLNFNSRLLKISFATILVLSVSIQIIGVSLKTHEWSVIAREFKDHPDPYYLPSEIKGSALLFKEKLSNDSGVYLADKFVTEHDHEIDLRQYESFYGLNFWIVHSLKFLRLNSFLKIVGNVILILVISILFYIFLRYKSKT